MSNVQTALKDGVLGGAKLNKDTVNMLGSGLTQSTYVARSGKPTNLLGHLLEKHQFGETPRFDLIAEATFLLNDPEGYRAAMRTAVQNEETEKTVRTLKTEQGRNKPGTGGTPAAEDAGVNKGARKIARPNKNFFSR